MSGVNTDSLPSRSPTGRSMLASLSAHVRSESFILLVPVTFAILALGIYTSTQSDGS